MSCAALSPRPPFVCKVRRAIGVKNIVIQLRAYTTDATGSALHKSVVFMGSTLERSTHIKL